MLSNGLVFGNDLLTHVVKHPLLRVLNNGLPRPCHISNPSLVVELINFDFGRDSTMKQPTNMHHTLPITRPESPARAPRFHAGNRLRPELKRQLVQSRRHELL